jgi:hypothetical protein
MRRPWLLAFPAAAFLLYFAWREVQMVEFFASAPTDAPPLGQEGFPIKSRGGMIRYATRDQWLLYHSIFLVAPAMVLLGFALHRRRKK